MKRESYVNIGMVTYGRLDFTKQALDALVEHTRYPYVLTVVDNGSRDGTREYLLDRKKNGAIKNLVLLEENIGVAKASNMAWLMELGADYYLKLDNDIVIQKEGWLENMVRALEKVKKIGVIGYNFETISYPVSEIKGIRLRIKPVGNVGGACALIPKRTWEKIGFWCEEYGLYGEEDSDYAARVSCIRLWNAYMEDEHIGLHLPGGRAAEIDSVSLKARDGMEERIDREYREWKDNHRKDILRSGRYQENRNGYKKGTRPLYVEPFFALQQLKSRFPRYPVTVRRRFVLRDIVFRIIHWRAFKEQLGKRRGFPES